MVRAKSAEAEDQLGPFIGSGGAGGSSACRYAHNEHTFWRVCSSISRVVYVVFVWVVRVVWEALGGLGSLIG